MRNLKTIIEAHRAQNSEFEVQAVPTRTKTENRMMSVFQTAAGAWHTPSILMAVGWLLSGIIIVANLWVNRQDRMKAFRKEYDAVAKSSEMESSLRDTLTKAQARSQASEAELQAVKQRVGWRHLSNRFKEMLAGRPAGIAEIVYREGDDEAYTFANNVWHALMAAGWKVSPPLTSKSKPGNASLPFMMREAGMVASDWSTVAVLTSGQLAAEPYEDDTPLNAVMRAFDAAGQEVLHLMPHDSLRPDPGTVRIVIGSRL